MDVYIYDPRHREVHVRGRVQRQHGDARTWTRFSATLPLSLAGKTDQGRLPVGDRHDKNTNFFVDTVALDVVACTATP